MAFDRQAAKQAGYSDEEIDAYLQSQPQTPAPAPGAAPGSNEPPPPTTTVTPAGEGGMMSPLATAGLAAAGAAVPFAAGYGVAKYGGRAADIARNLVGSPSQVPGAVNMPSAPVSGPVAPSSAVQVPPSTGGGARTPAMQTQMQQLRAPTAPTAAPTAPAMPAPAPAAQPASQISNAQRIVQALALDKLMKAGAGVAAAVTPGNVGQRYNFPMTGRYAGMEINPMTGRPWTPQELAQLGQ